MTKGLRLKLGEPLDGQIDDQTIVEKLREYRAQQVVYILEHSRLQHEARQRRLYAITQRYVPQQLSPIDRFK